MTSPFKFLDSYTKDDREIFFGREREIEELYHRVFESKIMLVYGVSGTGKSSLIHCGLANKFSETDWLPLVIRRGGNMVENMAGAISSASLTEQQSKFSNATDFKKGVRSLYLDHFKPVFFIFDQFEELFIFGDKEERRTFISIVKTLTESDLQCRFIFVMREEYMASISEFERYIPTIFSNRVRIEKMSNTNALEAIKGPCRFAGISFEEGFAEALLGKLSPESADVELTYLQVYLDKIFRMSESSKSTSTGNISFSIELLRKTGNVSDLLGSFLEEQIAKLDDPDNTLRVLKSFVSVKGTKKQMSLEEVSDFASSFGKKIDYPDLQVILQTFVNLRILRDKDDTGRYELRHDALATKIYEKITIVEKEILEIKHFIENAYANYEKRKIFLNPVDLSYISPYEDKLFLNKKLSDFINDSKREISARKKAFTLTLRYSAAGLLIIIFSVIIYYFRSSVNAKSEELSIEAYLQNDFSPSLSFQTALNAFNKDTASTIAIKALIDAFYSMMENGPYLDSIGNTVNPQKEIFDFTPSNSDISMARFSEDGQYIYGFLEDNTINVWDKTGKLVFTIKDDLNPVVSIKLSKNNKNIGVVYLDSTAIVWNLKEDVIFRSHVVFDPLSPVDAIDFSPDKDILTMLKGNNRITVYNLEDSSSYELKGHTGEVNGSVFSPDGRFIASSSKDSTVIIWQYNDSTGIYEKVNRLEKFKAKVWSADFAENSKYILCVSDSISYPVTIFSLTGKNVFKRRFYNDTIEKRFLSRFPKNYYGRYFHANFVAKDEAIRISTFSDKISLSDSLSFDPSVKYRGYDLHRIIYSKESFHLIKMNKYLKFYGTDRKGEAIDPNQLKYNYSFIDVSPKYFADNVSGTNYTLLTRLDRLPIRKFAGTNPLFSPDHNYLVCIDGKMLRLYPVDEKEIIRLVMEKSIFGTLDTDMAGWRHFLKDF